MKRVLAMLLAIVMVIGMVPVTVFATDTGTVTMRTDKHQIKPGETVTLTLSIDKTFTYLSSFEFDIIYDQDVFEMTDWENGEACIYTDAVADDGIIYVSAMDMTMQGNPIDLNEGVIMTMTLKAKEDVNANTEFTFDYFTIYGYNPDFYEYANEVASVIDTAVTVGNSADIVVGIPEDLAALGVSSITTDQGNAIAVEDWGTVEVDPWGSGAFSTPHYHVTVPNGTTEAYVRMDVPHTDLMFNTKLVDGQSVPSSVAGAYGPVIGESGGMASFEYKERGDDYTVFTMPMSFMGGAWGSETELSLLYVDEDTEYYAAGPEDTMATPMFVLSFEYEGGATPPEVPECEHVFTKENAVEAARATEATCNAPATYYYSCANEGCTVVNNAEGAETFSYGDPVDHVYVDGECKWCHTAEPKPITELSFYVKEDPVTEISVKEGESVDAVACCTPKATTEKDVVFSTDNDNITINATEVTADENGHAKTTVTGAKQGQSKLTVTSKTNPDVKAELTVNVTCGHKDTASYTTSYAQVEGTETHTITTKCACGEVMSSGSGNCEDADANGACDLCGGAVQAPVVSGPQVIYDSSVDGKWGTITLGKLFVEGVTVKSYQWSGNACVVTLAADTPADAAITFTYESVGSRGAVYFEKTKQTTYTTNLVDGAAEVAVATAASVNIASQATHKTITFKLDGTANVPVESITITPENPKVTASGGKITLTATVYPANATIKDVNWSTSASGTALTLTAEGVVLGSTMGVGQYYTVTATSVSNPEISASVQVFLDWKKETSITIIQETLSLTEGESAELSATVNGEAFVTNTNVSWSSNNESVATVDNKGNVTAVGAGTATITATSYSGLTDTCEVTVASASKPITDVVINNSELVDGKMELTTGAEVTLDVTITPEDTTQELVWASSDPAVATVENGVLKALSAGTATISATAQAKTRNGALVSFTVNVADKPIEVNGYSITMDTDKENKVGETVNVKLAVGHDSLTVYNSYKLELTYDPAVVKLTTATNGDTFTVVDNNGSVVITRVGADLTPGTDDIELSFEVVGAGETDVKLTKAYISETNEAVEENAKPASIIDNNAVVEEGTTKITVSGYTVDLPEEFEDVDTETPNVVNPGENFQFTAKDPYYDYDITVKVDDGSDEGKDISTAVTGSGTAEDPYTIPADQITGNVTVSTEKTGKKFDVAITEDVDMAPADGFTTGENAAQYMTDYKAVLTPDEKYEYTITITIGGETYTCTPENNVYTIAGSAIKGDINIEVTKTQVKFDPHNVTFNGTGAEDVVTGTAADKAEHAKAYTFNLLMAEGYEYTVDATMGGSNVTVAKAEEANDDGSYTYTIENVTADLVIVIEKSNLVVEVNEYVQLNEKTMFLVTATQTLPEGKSLAYDGTVMFFSEQYDAYAYLVIVNKGESFGVEDAKAKITIGDAQVTTLKATFDVNKSGAVDINDAQLIYDMYNNEYQNFEKATMEKFLLADVAQGEVSAKKLDVNDVAAIIAQINGTNAG